MGMLIEIKKVDIEITIPGYTEERLLSVFELLNKIDPNALDCYSVYVDEVNKQVSVEINGVLFGRHSSEIIDGLKDIFE